jgi:hypothetical protein
MGRRAVPTFSPERLMDGTSLLIGLLFGSIGFVYLSYGRKLRRMVPLGAGILMCVVPYLVSNNYAVVGICLTLMAAPLVFKQ